MFVQRARPNEVSGVIFYFMLMGCSHYNRDEKLDVREENLFNYLSSASEFMVTIFHSKKELRKSSREVAKCTVEKISGAMFRQDNLAVREYLKDGMVSYNKLVFGADFVELVEEKVSTIIKLMKDESYEQFALKHTSHLLVSSIEQSVIDEGTKKNFLKY